MSRPDGTPTNAVFGFTNMLIKLVEDLDADRIAIVFDAAKTSFRNDIYPDYKAQRPDAPEELVPQFGLIQDVVRAFNLPCIEMEGYGPTTSSRPTRASGGRRAPASPSSPPTRT